MNWDKYINHITAEGNTQRDRNITRLRNQINNKVSSNPSYKSVKLNGEETHLIINTGTKPYYKEFQSLPDQKVLVGDYIEWADSMWLVLNADSDDEVYVDGNLRQCQYRIYWQKSDGTIISRYAYIENASAYNNGETGNNTITLQSNQFMVYVPYDEETAELENGKRVHISRSNTKCRPYELTRPDDIAYGFGEKGVLNIIFTQTQYNRDKDKLITLEDGSQVWICDYIDNQSSTLPPTGNEMAVLYAKITGNRELKVGFSRKYSSALFDKNGQNIEWDENLYKWNVESDFIVEQTITGNKISLKTDNEDLIGKKFKLQVIKLDDMTVIGEIEIAVCDIM